MAEGWSGQVTVKCPFPARYLRPMLRSLRRSPALAIGIGLTLAVGVGALTATFGLTRADPREAMRAE